MKSLRVYRLVSKFTDDIYIGSTDEKYLSKRLAKHKNSFKRFMEGKRDGYVSSFMLCQYEDVSIELIEDNSSIEREGYFIKTTKNCVNDRVAGRTTKEYYKDNKEAMDKYRKQWCKDNKEARKKHKDKYEAKIHKCECGMDVKYSNRKRHATSTIHKNKMNGTEPIKETKEQQRAKYNARRREKIKCDHCDKVVSRAGMARHIKKIHNV